MRLYELTFDRNDWYKYRIEGEHGWSLPPLACDTCGARWKAVGESYSAVDVGDLAKIHPVETQRALNNEEFAYLRDQLIPLVPPGAPLNPGAEFGQFHGTARGRVFDFAWHHKWSMFLTEEARARLLDHGVRLPAWSYPELAWKQTARQVADPRLVEFDAIPVLALSLASLQGPPQPSCPRCGRQPGTFAKYVVDASSPPPDDIDLFRAKNLPALYIATERFAEAVSSLALTGCVLNPIRTE